MRRQALSVLMVLAATAVMVSGCGAAGTARTATSTTSGPPATTGVSSPPSVHLGDDDNGTTIKLARGATIVVVLNSTYWQFPTPASPSTVLAPVGSVVTAPAPIGTCVPGAGCGTVTATYQAVGPGQATITASRTTCGEALQCTGSAGSYHVTVDVAAG